MSGDVVYALDFDGVCCDSCDESSVTGVRAAVDMWGSAAGSEDAPSWLLRGMRTARPGIATGWENVVIARALFEAGADGVDALATSFTKDDWPPRRDAWLEQWGATKDELVEAFGSARDRWIASDRTSWVRTNRFYPGVVGALNFAAAELYIVTTKQRRFVDVLLEANGITSISSENIYGALVPRATGSTLTLNTLIHAFASNAAYGSGSKIETLKKILKSPQSAGKTVHFVEDRYETLEKTSLSMLGSPLRLYLATWGYNTQASRDEASSHPLIETLDLNTFVTKLQ